MIRDKIIPALDVQTKSDLDYLIQELKGEATIVKVGMELYYSYGNEVLKRLKDEGFKIFLDLKLHDIPNTVHNAAKTLAKNGVDILNVHSAGGIDMMKAALDGFKAENSQGILIGVTQLTSTSQEVMNKQLLIPGLINDTVLKYAEITKSAGLDGIVCSAMEVQQVKLNLGSQFKCITPGIRPKGVSNNDQKRVLTPSQAIKNGSDFLVIGRAITKSEFPKKAFKDILKEIENE